MQYKINYSWETVKSPFFVLLVSLQIHSLGLRAPAVWQTCGVFHIIIFLPQILHFDFECATLQNL